jgi:hypothetical protein
VPAARNRWSIISSPAHPVNAERNRPPESTEIAQEALLTGSDVGSLALARGLISAEQLAAALDPDTLTGRIRVVASGL